MKKFRRKPVEVEAMQVSEEGVSDVLDWMRDNGGPAMYTDRLPADLRVGDWIVRGDRGVAGEFYAVRGDVFAATYEEVQPPPEPFTLPVVLCPDCGHGIDPHGLDPGGPCGVNRCSCLWTPNDIAAISAEVFKKADRYDALRARVEAAMPTAREDFGGPWTALEWVIALLEEVQP